MSGLIDDITTPEYATAIGLLQYGATMIENESLTKLGGKFKLPVMGFAGKIIDTIKELLP
jgi:cell division ATPase FtsA